MYELMGFFFGTVRKFLLYRPAATSGVAIPYPSISLHAIQRLRLPSSSSNNTSDDEVQGLYMQIANPVAENMEDDEEEDSLTLTIVAPPVSEAASAALGSFTAGTETVALTMEEMMADEAAGADKPETAVQALFAAVSACSNLHPDPVVHGGEDDEQHAGVGSSLLQAGLLVPGSSDGGLPPPVDGSSGWITAENMDQYFDEEGNWIADGEPPSMPLGPGAGSVRPRDDGHTEEREEQGHAGDVGGAANGNDREETKWRRTD
jgi:nucleotide-sensitive chloride channel 1A